MKGLEALDYLKREKRRHWLDGDKSTECLDTIEKELKEGKKAKEERDYYQTQYAKTHTAYCKLKESKSKKEQALEVIGNKIGVTTILHNFGYLLEEQEYDLLKEVLLWKTLLIDGTFTI